MGRDFRFSAGQVYEEEQPIDRKLIAERVGFEPRRFQWNLQVADSVLPSLPFVP